jgi:hypothetical protein
MVASRGVFTGTKLVLKFSRIKQYIIIPQFNLVAGLADFRGVIQKVHAEP